MKGQRILFFDGVCNLCNALIDFLVRKDSSDSLSFAPLQGQTAKQVLPAEFVVGLNTLVYLEDGQTYTRSTAVLKIMAQLPRPWCWLSVLRFVPKMLRDLVYGLVARWRYQVFGQRSTCRVPTPAEARKFLS